MSVVVSLERLTKSYGDVRGIVDLDLTVHAGEVFGFLGPNGVGKTTTIRTMLDLIRPTSGRIRIFGLDARRDGVAVRRRVGYLPGDLRLYERMTPRELFRYFGALRRLRTIEEAERLSARFELELDRPINALSRGNRQKVGLVQAFMHNPRLIVLDEPTSSLDPLVQQTFSVAFGAIALLLGAATGHRGRAVGITAAAAITAYVVNGLAPLVEALEPLQKASPFYHYAASDPLREGLAFSHALILLAIAVVAAALVPLVFDRRDLAT